MKSNDDIVEIILGIKKVIPEFDKDKLLEYANWTIPSLYNSLKNNTKLHVNCDSNLLNKLLENKLKYKITDDIDRMSMQFLQLYNYEIIDGYIYIKVYASIYFYDNVINNYDVIDDSYNRYWNDIWIVTFKEKINNLSKINSNCINCGAPMKYNIITDIYKCDFCGNVIPNNFNTNLEITDIEIMK